MEKEGVSGGGACRVEGTEVAGSGPGLATWAARAAEGSRHRTRERLRACGGNSAAVGGPAERNRETNRPDPSPHPTLPSGGLWVPRLEPEGRELGGRRPCPPGSQALQRGQRVGVQRPRRHSC